MLRAICNFFNGDKKLKDKTAKILKVRVNDVFDNNHFLNVTNFNKNNSFCFQEQVVLGKKSKKIILTTSDFIDNYKSIIGFDAIYIHLNKINIEKLINDDFKIDPNKDGVVLYYDSDLKNIRQLFLISTIDKLVNFYESANLKSTLFVDKYVQSIIFYNENIISFLNIIIKKYLTQDNINKWSKTNIVLNLNMEAQYWTLTSKSILQAMIEYPNHFYKSPIFNEVIELFEYVQINDILENNYKPVDSNYNNLFDKNEYMIYSEIFNHFCKTNNFFGQDIEREKRKEIDTMIHNIKKFGMYVLKNK